MRDRIIMLMKTEGLTNSKFASILGIQRSNITHIIDGRNKPSWSFIEKLIAKFPSVNIEWLITGTGDMYKHREQNTGSPSPTLFPEVNIGQSSIQQEQQKILGQQEKQEPEKQLQPEQATESKVEDTLDSIESAQNEQEKKSEATTVPETKQTVESISENKTQNIETSDTVPMESKTVEKFRVHEIESVLIFYTDRTFKDYKPA